MRKHFLLAVASAATLLAATTASYFVVPSGSGSVPHATAAAVDYFLKIDGIEGESDDHRSPNAIEIDSFSWGVSQTGHSTGGGGGSGKATFQDISFKKGIDKSSPILFQSVPEGKHYKSATLMGRRTDGSQFMVVKLSDVLVSSFTQGAAGDMPTESFSLNYTKIEFDYMPQNPDGSTGAPVHGGWDVKANKKM